MKKVTIKTVSKYFLYTLLFVVLFTAVSFISYYFSEYTSIYKWSESSDCLIALIGTAITMIVIVFKET
jgi:preprotein translocase subunit SecY